MKMQMNNLWALPEVYAETVLRELVLRSAPEGMQATFGKQESADTVAPAGESAPAGTGSVAVITIDDALVSDAYALWGMSYGYIRRRVQSVLDDPSVSAILLNIDSPGGMVSGCQELAQFVADASKKKPMAAFTSGLMASAAYWIGSATGRVFCSETANVGSIGVIMTLSDYSEMLRNVGVKINIVSSGRFKSAGHPAQPLSDEDRSYFQKHAEAVHAVFRREVATAMGLDEAKAEDWGDAQIFMGKEALNNGLVTAVVRGLGEAVTMLSQEVSMDRATLATQHPELLQSILAEGEAKAVAERSFAPDQFLACVRPFMTDAAFAKAESFFKNCAAAKLTPEQMAAMAPMAKISDEETQKKDVKTEILTNLQKAGAHAVPQDPKNHSAEEKHSRAFMAAAEKM